MAVVSVVGVGSVVDGGSVVGVGGLMVFLVIVDKETEIEMERGEGKERKSSF